jgi:hypothetical protein
MNKFNDGKHIAEVIDRTSCSDHQAESFQPCWDVRLDTRPDSLGRAVCGRRIRAAGFNGKISETSVQSKKKHDKKKEVNA